MAKVHTSRNPELVPGIGRYSRSAVYKKRALYKRKKTGVKKVVKEQEKFKRKEIGGDKNGGSRVVPVKRESRFYPTEDVPKPLAHRKKPGKAKLRPTIVPGTVLILLAGNHRGKRVVFLKQLESGLLLVTGPYKVNGVPLRRVAQTYVIATSTLLDISKVTLPDNLNDDYFKREPKKKKRSEDMFEDTEEDRKVSDKRIEDQKTVDDQVLPLISNVAHMKKYLKTLFSLRKGQYPHEMKF
ncbi:60S ribosomal protein L6-like [Actinia tenebrosa]|uniref:Large ribosomal subunit protein eL6 n=1 Tax=Actinia tenebrosa TaxID=6105 RepID=A0A6P8HF32_ACTTE|nr:60S ribosomal protein L6-like [Actinia tenebrosa]